MYITPGSENGRDHAFDWESFFEAEKKKSSSLPGNPEQAVTRSRHHLKENRFRLALSLNKLMGHLLKYKVPDSPDILELGAATGFLTRWFIEKYGGSGLLVDSSRASFETFNTLKDNLKEKIDYLQKDIFQLELEERFDLVCSFGLIEHFKEKSGVLEIHKKFLAPGGAVVILVPADTPLSRVFFELHPELNLGYRELLKGKELKQILVQVGLRVLRIQCSAGYVYDFYGALCIPN